MKIGIVGARKFQDEKSVVDLVLSLPAEATIITSPCKGVCTWAREVAEERRMKVTVFAPDLENIRAWFDIPKRYYQRNKEMVEACDLLHAFISAEDGFIGGTRFEVDYAVSLGIPVQIHWEKGLSQWIFQYSFPFLEGKQAFLLSWKRFFRKIEFELADTPQGCAHDRVLHSTKKKPGQEFNAFATVTGKKRKLAWPSGQMISLCQ